MRFIHLATTDSTMLEARRRLAKGEHAPFTVIAERQTGGVGRLGRPWSSPPGGWWLTVASPLNDGCKTVHDDTALCIADWVLTACRAAMAAQLGTDAPELKIKWPNDVLAGDLKLAGVLIEIVGTEDGPVALVGVGVNANVAVADLDEGVRDRATSLRALMNRDVDAKLTHVSLTMIADRIDEAVAPLAHAPGAVAGLVRPRLWGVGRTVPITLPDGVRVHGRVDGITDEGNLLATIDGEQRVLRSVEQIG
jgi:BirA family biotin operon repressor/biotin-[acetyl-CoA-carboxylase] ligase